MNNEPATEKQISFMQTLVGTSKYIRHKQAIVTDGLTKEAASSIISQLKSNNGQIKAIRIRRGDLIDQDAARFLGHENVALQLLEYLYNRAKGAGAFCGDKWADARNAIYKMSGSDQVAAVEHLFDAQYGDITDEIAIAVFAKLWPDYVTDEAKASVTEVPASAVDAPYVRGGGTVIRAPEFYGFAAPDDSRAFEVEGRDGDDGCRLTAWLRRYSLAEAITPDAQGNLPVLYASVVLPDGQQYRADWTAADDGTLLPGMRPMQFVRASVCVSVSV